MATLRRRSADQWVPILSTKRPGTINFVGRYAVIGMEKRSGTQPYE
jgi:hypothetical protein